MTMTPEKAQELLDHYEQISFAGIVSVDYVSGFLRAYIAQAAELTRLRAKVEAADKLAEAVRAIDYEARTDRESAALSAYEGVKG